MVIKELGDHIEEIRLKLVSVYKRRPERLMDASRIQHTTKYYFHNENAKKKKKGRQRLIGICVCERVYQG